PQTCARGSPDHALLVTLQIVNRSILGMACHRPGRELLAIEKSRAIKRADPKGAVRIWQQTSDSVVLQSLDDTEGTPASLFERSEMESEIRHGLLRIEVDDFALEQRHRAAMC